MVIPQHHLKQRRLPGQLPVMLRLQRRGPDPGLLEVLYPVLDVVPVLDEVFILSAEEDIQLLQDTLLVDIYNLSWWHICQRVDIVDQADEGCILVQKRCKLVVGDVGLETLLPMEITSPLLK